MKQDHLNNCPLMHCYKSIMETRHCQDCKEILPVPTNKPKVILENLSGGMWMVFKMLRYLRVYSVHAVHNLQPFAFDLAVAMISVTVKCYCA